MGGLLLFTGCMVGPNYCPPELNYSDAWSANLDESCSEIALEWWKVFEDSDLNELIQKAKDCNYSIAMAEAKIAEARGLKQTAASKLYPHLSFDSNANKYYFSKNGFLSLFDRANLPPVIPQIETLFNALLDVSWELDIFGKTRRTVEAAEAYLESQIEGRNDVLLSVLAEVATTYLDLRATQQRIALARRNIWVTEQQLDIALRNAEEGYIDQIGLDQAKKALSDAKAQIPNLFANLLSDIYSISVLIGQPPETLVEQLSIERPIPRIPDAIALGLRSDLLRRRPDVRKAERELAAATATIGIAVASFFPVFSFSNQDGYQSLTWGKLFDWDSRTWNAGIDLRMPIFQGGRIVGNLHVTQALAVEKAKNYQKTVLEALQEAETSLSNFRRQIDTLDSQTESVQSSRDIWALTLAQYDRGLVNRTQALSAEQKLVQTEDLWVQDQQIAFSRLITLYKALGGGWESVDNEID